MVHILVVEDDEKLNRIVCTYLNDSGFQAKGCLNAREAYDEMYNQLYDLIISDIMIPEIDGFEFARTVREINKTIPILFMSARDDFPSKKKGFDLGIDDYMVKPFLPRELLFRIAAVLRRSYKEEDPLVKLNGCEIDLERAEVIKNGEHIPLTAKEFALLSALYRNAGRIVTIDALCEAAWGDNPYGYENSLMAHVRRIREKIEENPSKPVSLVTVKGLGYKLILARQFPVR